MSDETTNTDVSKATAAGGVDAAREHAQAQSAATGEKEGEAKGTQAFEPEQGTKRDSQVSTDGEATTVAAPDAATTAPDQAAAGTQDAPDTAAEARAEYKVLTGVEYPRGTAHEAGKILSLTDQEAGEFAPGLIEKVEQGGTGSDQA